MPHLGLVFPSFSPIGAIVDLFSMRLRDAGVETRPIVAGNFTLNPVIEHLDHSIHGDLPAANRIHNQGFFVGNHHYDITDQLNEFKRILKQCLDVQRPASND